MSHQINQYELKLLRDKLPKKYAETLSKTTGLSKSLVYAVLAGNRENETIFDAAMKLANDNLKKKKEQIDKLKEIAEA